MSKAKKQPLQPSLLEIMLIQIVPSKSNPRKSFDESSIKDLAESMKANGLIQPITLRMDADGFEIVAGERRFRAAQLLGWDRIPAIVREVRDEDMLEIQILENLQREDVSPIDEANAFQSLLKKESLEWLCAKIHKSKKYVSDRLKLRDLNTVAQQLVTLGKLPLTYAIVISKLEPNSQEKVLGRLFYSIDFEDPKENSETDLQDAIPTMGLSALKDLITDSFIDLRNVPFRLDIDELNMRMACNDCPKRTCNQQLLFAEITEEDKCTDSVCYNEKLKRHIDMSIQKAKDQYGKVLMGSSDPNSSQGIIVGGKRPERVSDKPGKGLVPVVYNVVDRWAKDKLGKVVWVPDPAIAVKEKKAEPKGPSKAEEYNAMYAPRLAEIISKVHKSPAISAGHVVGLIAKKLLEQVRVTDAIVMANACGIETNISSESAYEFCQGLEYKEREELANKIKALILEDLSDNMVLMIYALSENINEWVEDDEEIDNIYDFNLNILLNSINYK